MREFGYTIGGICTDIEEHPRLFGELLSYIEIEGKLKAEQTGDAKLSEKDATNPVKAAAWAAGRSQQSKANIAGAEAALMKKFPGMMR
jgi:hypothetical protein